jgi:hypothetical protein
MYAVLMDLSAMINMPSFIMTGLVIQMLLGDDLINTILFFKNKEGRL